MPEERRKKNIMQVKTRVREILRDRETVEL